MTKTERSRQQSNSLGENIASTLWCSRCFLTISYLEHPSPALLTLSALQIVREAEYHWLLGPCGLWRKEGKWWKESRCSGSKRGASTLARTKSSESVTSDPWGKALVSTVASLCHCPPLCILHRADWERLKVLLSVSCFFDVPGHIHILDITGLMVCLLWYMFCESIHYYNCFLEEMVWLPVFLCLFFCCRHHGPVSSKLRAVLLHANVAISCN